MLAGFIVGWGIGCCWHVAHVLVHCVACWRGLTIGVPLNVSCRCCGCCRVSAQWDVWLLPAPCLLTAVWRWQHVRIPAGEQNVMMLYVSSCAAPLLSMGTS
jgi:hypothetical protein